MHDGTFLMGSSEQLKQCIPVFAGSLIGLTNDTVLQGPQAQTYSNDIPEGSDEWNNSPIFFELLHGRSPFSSITKEGLN